MRKGSIQQVFVAVDAIQDDVICLEGSGRQHREYRAALEIGSINFTLKSEQEQEAILASYAACLNGLSHPMQVLILVRPLDLEPYLQSVRAGRQVGCAGDRDEHALLDRLTEEYVAFVKGLAMSRTLLTRRFLVVIPADAPGAIQRDRFLSQLQLVFRHPRQALGSAHHWRQEFSIACQQLDLRTEALMAEFARMGLAARRLPTQELVAVYQQMIAPERAATYPVDEERCAVLLTPSHSQPIEPILMGIPKDGREPEGVMGKEVSR